MPPHSVTISALSPYSATINALQRGCNFLFAACTGTAIQKVGSCGARCQEKCNVVLSNDSPKVVLSMRSLDDAQQAQFSLGPDRSLGRILAKLALLCFTRRACVPEVQNFILQSLALAIGQGFADVG